MRKRGLVVVLSVSLLAACAWSGERTRPAEDAVSRTAVPTASGVVGGGSLGGEGTWKNAAPGGLGAGTIGSYMDRQKNDVEPVLARQDRVERQGEALRVVLSSDVLFGTRARLQASARDKLDRIARVLNAYPRTRLDIIGHTDSRGRARANDALSERRAVVVRDVLVHDGVDPARMTVRGAGETRPVATNDTADGRAANRRVEIVSRPDDTLVNEARRAAPPPPDPR